MKKMAVVACCLLGIAAVLPRMAVARIMLLDFIGVDKSNGQYFDTGYLPNANTEITMEFQAKDTDGGYVFGTYENGSKARCQFLYKTSYLVGFGGTYDNTHTLVFDQNWHTIGLTNGVFRLDGTALNANAFEWDGVSQHSLYLFHINRSDGLKTTDISSFRLRSLVIREQGAVIHQFVPAKNTVLDKVGLFDLKSAKMKFPAGTGELELGDEIGSLDGDVYVSPEGGSISPFFTPETAATNLADAIAFLKDNPDAQARVVVAPGTYDVKDANGVTVPANATLVGDGPLGSVVITNSVTLTPGKGVLNVSGGTVSNLVIRGGVSAGSAVGSVPSASGVYVEKGLITHCEIAGCQVLEENYTTSGCCAQALVLGVTGAATDSAIACACKIVGNVGSFGTTTGVGTYPRASAVFVANGGRLERCEVANNRGSPGGVTMINDTNFNGKERLVDGCDIHDNFSYTLPGGILLGTFSRVWNSRIASNRVERGVNSLGGGVRAISMQCELVNCLIEGNEADVGGGLYFSTMDNRIVHCTVVGNTAGTAGGLETDTGSAGTLLNTIIVGNVSEQGGIQIHHTGGAFVAKNCCLANLPNGWTDDGTDDGNNLIGVDPKFVNPAAHDWHLEKNSPCIDTGLADYPTPYATGKDYAADFDGTVRPQDGTRSGGTPLPDMGCYEYVYTKGLIIFVK